MITLTVLLALGVGLSLGLLGGGGSILMVPLLAYVAGLDAAHAIATSLLVVGVTSVVGAVSHARAGHVQWRTGLMFGAAGMVGAYAGGWISQFLPGSLLLVGLAAVMISAAIAMLRGRTAEAVGSVQSPTGRPVTLVLQGAAVGLVTGLVGAGGGFLVVPALALLTGLPMATAIGTSLMVIAMNSFAGLAGHLSAATIDWRLAAGVTGAAVVGALAGARLTEQFSVAALRIGFGWFVLAMASVILAQEIHPLVGALTATLTALSGVLYASCRLGYFCPLRALYPRG
ncbi:sulfite exporter TauE/SafE family protein [Mycolicibacterium obuense]|uniref:Probable membrane transporter protein n=1 Tax=Mycolicibacterium obuense TaxID=1807 RepID=A0A0M2K2S3_9MYCO|nr:sulfite exporter TauE/SafE family protein [Mycolicibacterium obuense]KKF01230.1 membrane protein [Mycolicibacterium obuense]TDL08532.1 sulfite exporter TauE/SafE family protein [Mycolicibacterium obuense]